MNSPSSIAGRLTVLTLTVLTFIICSMAQPAAAQSQYAVADLGTLPTFNSSDAGGTNASGQVAGWSSTPGGIDHAFCWSSPRGIQTPATRPFTHRPPNRVNTC